jgi:hypothetical protein
MREENVEWGVGGENYASCGTVDVSYLLRPTLSGEMPWMTKRHLTER